MSIGGIGRRMATEQMKSMTERLKVIKPDVDMPLSHFKHYLLPVIARHGDNFDMDEYLKVVGHPSAPVRVYADEDINKTIYSIPPILNDRKYASRGIDLTNLMLGLDQYAAAGRGSKVEVLYHALKSKNDGQTRTDSLISALHMVDVLNKIFTDHNLPVIDLGPRLSEVWVGYKSGRTAEEVLSVEEDKTEDVDYHDGYDLV